MANRKTFKPSTTGANPKWDAMKTLNGESVDKAHYDEVDEIWFDYWITRHEAAKVAKDRLAELEERNRPNAQINQKQQAGNNAKMAEVFNNPAIAAAFMQFMQQQGK